MRPKINSAGAPCVFLFDREQLAEAESWGYHTPALRAVIAAVLDADTDASESFELRFGDLLLHNLAYKTTGVESGTSRPGTRSIATSTAGDTDLYRTLIWDFSDSIGERWHSADLQLLDERLGRLEVSAISLSFLLARQRQKVDAALRHAPFYLGAFEPDAGNPIHWYVAEESLIHECDYLDRSLLFDPWRSEDPFHPPPLVRHGDEWYAPLPLNEVRYKTGAEGAQEGLVNRWPAASLSERGARSQAILKERGDPGHLGRVADAVSALRLDANDPAVSVDAGAMARAADAIVEERKLIDYALNTDHDKGGGDKARWFLAALGISREDWRHLAGQLRLGLIDAHVGEVRATQYGVQYAVTTTVRGLNGASARVTSAWEVREGEPPRLTTVFPAKRVDDPPEAPPALIVPGSLKGADHWKALWDIADGRASEASTKVIPTPMKVDGQWYSEGAFGFAWISVPDARRNFARWLRQTDRARLRSGRGATFMAPGSTIDRARAYAESFAEVLRLNGVEAQVDWTLD
jgi:hypothetical protein